MNLLYKYELQEGYTSIIKQGESDLKYADFGVLRLNGNRFSEFFKFTSQK